jgi:hypothetical protein
MGCPKQCLLWSQSFPVQICVVQPIELVSNDFIRGGLLVASQEMDLRLLLKAVLGATISAVQHDESVQPGAVSKSVNVKMLYHPGRSQRQWYQSASCIVSAL